MEATKASEELGKKLFLPLGHDRCVADALRADGWRTVTALDKRDDARELGCSHVLDSGKAKAL